MENQQNTSKSIHQKIEYDDHDVNRILRNIKNSSFFERMQGTIHDAIKNHEKKEPIEGIVIESKIEK